jgi:hypothetical protein
VDPVARCVVGRCQSIVPRKSLFAQRFYNHRVVGVDRLSHVRAHISARLTRICWVLSESGGGRSIGSVGRLKPLRGIISRFGIRPSVGIPMRLALGVYQSCVTAFYILGAEVQVPEVRKFFRSWERRLFKFGAKSNWPACALNNLFWNHTWVDRCHL